MNVYGAYLFATCLLLSGCATSPPVLKFTKAGSSAGQLEGDSEDCWNYAFTSPEARRNAELITATRLIGGGVSAAANIVAEQSANKDDAKKDLGNWSNHRDCMIKKGYASSMFN